MARSRARQKLSRAKMSAALAAHHHRSEGGGRKKSEVLRGARATICRRVCVPDIPQSLPRIFAAHTAHTAKCPPNGRRDQKLQFDGQGRTARAPPAPLRPAGPPPAPRPPRPQSSRRVDRAADPLQCAPLTGPHHCSSLRPLPQAQLRGRGSAAPPAAGAAARPARWERARALPRARDAPDFFTGWRGYDSVREAGSEAAAEREAPCAPTSQRRSPSPLAPAPPSSRHAAALAPFPPADAPRRPRGLGGGSSSNSERTPARGVAAWQKVALGRAHHLLSPAAHAPPSAEGGRARGC